MDTYVMMNACLAIPGKNKISEVFQTLLDDNLH